MQHLARPVPRRQHDGRRLPHHGAGPLVRPERLRPVADRQPTSGSGAGTGGVRTRTRPRPSVTPQGPSTGAAMCCAAGRTCATTRTASGTATRLAPRTRPTRRRATSGSGPSRAHKRCQSSTPDSSWEHPLPGASIELSDGRVVVQPMIVCGVGLPSTRQHELAPGISRHGRHRPFLDGVRIRSAAACINVFGCGSLGEPLAPLLDLVATVGGHGEGEVAYLVLARPQDHHQGQEVRRNCLSVGGQRSEWTDTRCTAGSCRLYRPVCATTRPESTA